MRLITLLFLFISFSAVFSARRLMKPDPDVSYSALLTEDSWKVLAVYSQSNLEFFKQTTCLTLGFKWNPKDPSKYHSAQNQETSETDSYFYDSQAQETESKESSDGDYSSEFFGLIQNMTWFNFSDGSYHTQFDDLDFGKDSQHSSDEGIFFENGIDTSDDTWIVSFDNGQYYIFGRKDATEIYLLVGDVFDNECSDCSSSDDVNGNEEAYHAFNASLLDTQNVLYNTYPDSCQIEGPISSDFNLEEFASKNWYVQVAYFPLFDENPPAQALCGEYTVTNITKITNTTIVNFNYSFYTKNESETVWTTVNYEYYEDPLYPGVFRPFSSNAPQNAMAFNYFDETKGLALWSNGETTYGYLLNDIPDQLGSDDILQTEEIVNEIAPNDGGQQIFRAMGCKYH